ncbi:MAG: class I SAM-dependent methyltransferase [Candidatus Methanoperedens sp.]|nr:class I SAM-dependent methyltransferase [Candidatus Methanoperedens sp.]
MKGIDVILLIHDILGLNAGENIYFVEDSYAAIKHNSISLDYLENIREDPEAYFEKIIDENGNTLGIVLLNPENEESPEFRAVFTDIVSSKLAPNESSKHFSDISGKLKINKTYNTTIKKFSEAVFEYFSNALVNREFCDNCLSTKEPYEMVYIKSRNARLKALLDKFKLKGDILEICCGNGMSTLPMHEMGYNPLATDIDRCQICQGLEHKVLDPARTVILDATRLSDFFPQNRFDTITGFMLGTIYQFNKGIWEKMIFEAVNVLKPGGMILLTVNKKEEMEILYSALNKAHITGKMIDNTDEMGIYDQWVYVGTS